MRFASAITVLAAIVSTNSIAAAQAAPRFDLVIANGRVIDPKTGLDATRWVGIS